MSRIFISDVAGWFSSMPMIIQRALLVECTRVIVTHGEYDAASIFVTYSDRGQCKVAINYFGENAAFAVSAPWFNDIEECVGKLIVKSKSRLPWKQNNGWLSGVTQ